MSAWRFCYNDYGTRMLLEPTQPVNLRHQGVLDTFDARLREADMFHAGTGPVHTTLDALAANLESSGIDYAVIGAMALNAHGFRRETVDVDVLVTPAGLDAFRERWVGRGYVPAFSGARKSFKNAETNVKVVFVLSGEYPGDGKPKPVAFPDPAAVAVRIDKTRVISLPRLIELKLASGMTNRGRLRDLADVQDLIATLELGEEMAAELDPFVRATYLDLLNAVRTERRPDE